VVDEGKLSPAIGLLIQQVAIPLLRAAHIGPSVAVTTIAGLLALALGLDGYEAVVVTLAVFTGQLTIGWGNDLLDADRDRDEPGHVDPRD